MKTISLCALFATLVSALFLYVGTQPIPGALQIIGDRKTEQEIRTFEQRRQLQVYVGFALLAISAVAQGVVLYRDPRPRGLTPERVNPRDRKEGEDIMEEKSREDLMARERIRYQWMLDSVAKVRLYVPS